MDGRGPGGRSHGNHHPSICPYGFFATADGAVQISVGSEGLWHRFCEGFGIDPDTPGISYEPPTGRQPEAGDRDGQVAFAPYCTVDLLERNSTESGFRQGKFAM